MKQPALVVICALMLSSSLHAQDWERRHAFAKSYYGLNMIGVPSMGQGIAAGAVSEFNRSGFISPAVNIGATHFWGHADFYVSINTVPIKLEEDAVENSLHMGTFTGLRVYPWPVGTKEIRPFLGYKFSPWRYRQGASEAELYKVTNVKGAVDCGFGLQTERAYFTLGASKLLNPDFEMHSTPLLSHADELPEWFVELGLNVSIETTSVAATDASRRLNQKFAASNRHGLFIAAGPSSAFPTASSEFIADEKPFLDDLAFPTIFPDVAIGYHLTTTDAVVALSARSMRQNRSAFDESLEIKRQSRVLEGYKFVGDYHGFAPYVGLGVGEERIVLESYAGADLTDSKSLTKYPWYVVFGWDIRPSVKGDLWVLRTNLRVPPSLTFSHEGSTLSMQHLEFNFIQLVIYPQRWKEARKAS